jgi:hypothetical protein
MRFSVLGVVGVALSSCDLTVAVPARSPLEVIVLGGSTFRIKQAYNQNFRPQYQGVRAMAKAYNKYGIAYSPELLALLEQILKEFGLTLGSGKGVGGGIGSGQNPGQGSGSSPGQTGSGGNSTSTTTPTLGAGQGMYFGAAWHRRDMELTS